MAKKIKLTNQDDDFKGSGKDEIINAKGGDDNVSGGGGNDTINGGAGNDSLKGGAGDDTLNGGEGNDILLGGTGDDTLNGGTGENTADGGDGDDTIVLDGNFADAKISEDGNGGWVITTAGGTTKVSNVELFQFADGTKTEDELIVVPPGTGKTFVLTVPLDNVAGTAGADTIIGDNQTLTADLIAGGEGDDVLRVTTGTAGNYAPTMSGVERVEITSGTGGGSNFNFANVTGLKTVSFAGGNQALTASTIKTIFDLEVSNTLAGSTVVLGYDPTSVAGATDTQKLSLSNAVLNSLTVTGIETLAVTSVGKNTVTALVDDNLKAITSAGAGDLTLAVPATAAAFASFDASTATGKQTITFGGGDLTAKGGTANDTFDFGATFDLKDTVDGGAGRDTIAVSSLTGLVTGNKLTNVEILRVNGAATGTVDTNLIPLIDAIVHNSTAAMVYSNIDKVDAADGVNGGVQILNNGAVTVGVEGAGALGSTTDALYVSYGQTTGTFAGGDTSALQTVAGVAAGGLTAADVELVTIKVNADAGGQTAAGTGALTLAALQTLTITGGAVGEAFSVNAGAALGTVGTLARIDGSAFTGNLTVSGNAGAQVVIGGSGADSLATGGRAAFTGTEAGDVLTGGAGGDTFVFAASDSTATLPNAAVAGTFTGAQLALFSSITDLNLGDGTAAGAVDKVNLADVFDFAGAATVVNGGAATALTGASFGAAVDALINNGVLDHGGATGTALRAGLFTWGGQTFLIANESATAATAYTTTDTVVVNVTGVTGTLDATDLVL